MADYYKNEVKFIKVRSVVYASIVAGMNMSSVVVEEIHIIHLLKTLAIAIRHYEDLTQVVLSPLHGLAVILFQVAPLCSR